MPDPALSSSALRVLRELAKGEATYRELMIRVRPMSEAGVTQSIYQLTGHKLAYLSERGVATITDAGRERLA